MEIQTDFEVKDSKQLKKITDAIEKNHKKDSDITLRIWIDKPKSQSTDKGRTL